MATFGIPDQISFGDMISSSIPTLTVQSSNLLADLDSSHYPAALQIIVECLRHSALSKALTASKDVPLKLLNLAFSSAKYNKAKDVVSFEVIGGKVLQLSKPSFARLLGLSSSGQFVTPSIEELIATFNQMGHTPYMTKISQFKKSKLPTVWNFFFGVLLRCLCGRNNGLDAAGQSFLTLLYGVFHDVSVDYTTILWQEFVDSLNHSKRDTEISCHRFWSLIVYGAYSFSKIPINENDHPMVEFQKPLIPTRYPNQSHFDFVGQVPEAMLRQIPADNDLLVAYRRTLTIPYPVRETPPEVVEHAFQAAEPRKKKRKPIVEAYEKPEITKGSKRICDNVLTNPLNDTLSIDSPQVMVEENVESDTLFFGDDEGVDHDPDFTEDMFHMAPIGVDADEDEDEDVDDDVVMSKRDFKILNRKLNLLIQLNEAPTQLSKQPDVDKLVSDWSQKFMDQEKKINELVRCFVEYRTQLLTDSEKQFEATRLKWESDMANLQQETANLGMSMKALVDEVHKCQAINNQGILKSLIEAQQREIILRKSLHDALSHIKFLESSVKIYDQQAIAHKYNEEVVNAIQVVHQGVRSQLDPISQLLTRLSGCASKSTGATSSQGGDVRLGLQTPSGTTYKGNTPTTILSKEKEQEKIPVTRENSSKKQIDMNDGFITQVWNEETIRDLACKDDVSFFLLPKASYSTENTLENQIDLPITPKAFCQRRFLIKAGEMITHREYNEKLIRFHVTLGKRQGDIWSLKAIKKIIEIKKGDLFEGIFQNYSFKVIRGNNDKMFEFTLADFPLMNPNDLINLLKILMKMDKGENSRIITHIRSCLVFYYNELAGLDFVLAKRFNNEVPAPIVKKNGIENERDGRIIQKPDWGVVYSKPKKGGGTKKLFFRIDEKEKFPDETLDGILKRIAYNDSNPEAERKKVDEMLRWWMAVRKVALEAVSLVFD